MLKRLAAALLIGAVYAASALSWPFPAGAQVVSSRQAVCDPQYPTRCIKPDASGNVPVTITSGAGGLATEATLLDVKTNTTGLALETGGNLAASKADLDTLVAAAANPAVVTQSTASSLNAQVVGVAASGASVSGNPLLPGCKAINTPPTAVTNGQMIAQQCSLTGKLIIQPYANPENFVSAVTAAMTGTTSTLTLAAPAAGLRNYVTHLSCVNSHATVGTFINVQDGSGGTTLYTGAAAAVFGGFSFTFPVPLRQPTTATGLYVADVTTGANVVCSVSGYSGI